jgi:hypothetical protein
VIEVSRPIAIRLPPDVVPDRVPGAERGFPWAIVRRTRATVEPRLHSAPMGAQQIANNLALINWTVLVALAIGTFAVVVFARLRTPATKGFLSFTAACAVGWGVLAYLSDTALVLPAGAVVQGSPVIADPSFDVPRRTALVLFLVLATLTTLVLARGGRARIPGVAGLVAGLLVLLLGGLTWGGNPAGVFGLSLQLLVLTLVTGGVFAAMILGHWYLVTPKLPEQPLILLARVLLVVVAVQVVLFWAWIATGAGPADVAPFSSLTGPWALFVWLRLIVGLVFPLIVCWASVQTARTRSMESATGLLYINVGSIAAGTILAAGLYFGAGLLV